MRALLVVVLVLHGVIHAIGFMKAFGLVELDALSGEITRSRGALWLGVAIALIVTAGLAATSSRTWPFVALPALVLSQALVLGAWSDAKVGTLANVALLAATIVALVDQSPSSLRSTYAREVERGLARDAGDRLVSEDDLASLPPLVQSYLRRAGVVGKPRVQDVRIAWRAEMRRAPDAAWMSLRAEQHSFFGEDPTRLFFMEGAMYGLPFVGLHRYAGGRATMDVRVASLWRVVDGRGPKMDQSETVTMFNDICVFAPAALLDAPVTWEPVDGRRVRGTYALGSHSVSAELVFDAAGDLVDFVSYDRYESADGKTYRNYRWSTPLSGYRDFGGHRVAAHGDATWAYPSGDFIYGRFDIESIEYNVGGAMTKRDRPEAMTSGRSAGSIAVPARYGF